MEQQSFQIINCDKNTADCSLVHIIEKGSIFETVVDKSIKNAIQDGRDISVEVFKRTDKTDFRITRFHLQALDIKAGDKIKYCTRFYEIHKINEIRDHQGQFSNPEWNKNSFFDVQAFTFLDSVITKKQYEEMNSAKKSSGEF